MISTKIGDYLNLKRGIPHKFKNIGNTKGKLIVILSPPGLEKLFVEIGQPVQNIDSFDFSKKMSNASKSIDQDTRLKTLANYGITEVNERR